MKKFYLFYAFFCLVSFHCALNACTAIMLQPKDGSTVHGRTVEFGIYIDSSVVFVPRGHEFIAKTPLGDGLKYKSKYASTGVIAFDDLQILDGLNEAGLAVGAFYFSTFAEYTPVTKENQAKGLSPTDFTNWLLTQFASVKEIKEALEKQAVVITPTIIEKWGSSAPPPFHYIAYDKSGASLVIEPIKGQLKLYDNPLGVITNSPTFDWHMTNLRNYIALNPFNSSPRKLGSITLEPLGQGTGMLGLPGDFSPPSRFVRATAFSTTAMPEENAEKAIFQLFHLLNNFDIPVGIAREKVDGVLHTDYTMLTVARNPHSLRYFYKTYDDQNIRFVDLSKFDFKGDSVKRLSTKGAQSAFDMSDKLSS